MGLLENVWVQVGLGVVLLGLIVWWFKYRPDSY
jgi:hypothetical protein